MNTVPSRHINSPRRHPHDVSVSLSSDPNLHPIRAPSHNSRSLPRRSAVNPNRSFILFLLLTCFYITLSTAEKISLSEPMFESTDERHANEDFLSSFERLAHAGTILVDESPPPNPGGGWVLASEHEALVKRADRHNRSSSVSSTPTPSKTLTSSSTSTSSSSTGTRIETQATQGPIVLPTPFDSGFSSNVTDSCASFLDGFLTNAEFKACLPFSLLLENSNSFFQASKSLVRITQTLDATCSANSTSCTTLMTTLATNLTSSSNCGSDLAAQNPLISQAHIGLLAYKPLYTASCLRNPSTSSYCYADAITNATNPTDSYIYYLPLNTSLPGGSQPTCGACTKDTMNVFEAATSDRKSAIAGTYGTAAMQVNVQCGPGFVNSSLAAVVNNGAIPAMVGYSTGWMALVIVVMGLLF